MRGGKVMKKIFVFLLVLLFVLPAFGEPIASAKGDARFKDLKTSNPAYNYVDKMVSYGVIEGYPDGTFKGEKTITRAEFSKVMASSINYLEKRYGFPLANEINKSDREISFSDLGEGHWAYPYVEQLVVRYGVFEGYPDGSFKPKKNIIKYEAAVVVGRAFEKILARVKLPVKSMNSGFSDVKSTHWAKGSIDILSTYKILNQGDRFNGNGEADRYFVATVAAKFIGIAIAKIDALGPEKIEELRKKYTGYADLSLNVDKRLFIGKPRAFLSGLYGNLYEGGSGTNNWANFGGSLSYGNKYYLGFLKGDYEITGRVLRDEIVYLTSGGSVTGGFVNEYRTDIDINTISTIANIYGTEGLLLLGVKYAYFSNSISPMNFWAANAGIVAKVPMFGTKMMAKIYYSLLPSVPNTTSVLGAPASILNYEAGFDVNMFNIPMLFGYSGETMFLNVGNYTRVYNMLFLSCSLI